MITFFALKHANGIGQSTADDAAVKNSWVHRADDEEEFFSIFNILFLQQKKFRIFYKTKFDFETMPMNSSNPAEYLSRVHNFSIIESTLRGKFIFMMKYRTKIFHDF